VATLRTAIHLLLTYSLTYTQRHVGRNSWHSSRGEITMRAGTRACKNERDVFLALSLATSVVSCFLRADERRQHAYHAVATRDGSWQTIIHSYSTSLPVNQAVS